MVTRGREPGRRAAVGMARMCRSAMDMLLIPRASLPLIKTRHLWIQSLKKGRFGVGIYAHRFSLVYIVRYIVHGLVDHLEIGNQLCLYFQEYFKDPVA